MNKPMPKRNKRKKIEIPNEEFLHFAIDKVIRYGKGINIWWKIRGCKDFFKWAKENGMDYIKEA